VADGRVADGPKWLCHVCCLAVDLSGQHGATTAARRDHFRQAVHTIGAGQLLTNVGGPGCQFSKVYATARRSPRKMLFTCLHAMLLVTCVQPEHFYEQPQQGKIAVMRRALHHARLGCTRVV